jgi:hypothetical protein
LYSGAILGLLLLLAPACTENDEQLVDEVGVTRLVVIDPGLLGQSIISPFERIQVAEWESDTATLEVGDSLLDPFFGEPCSFKDTVRIAPFAEGPCASGIVIESSDDPFEVDLTLSITSMQVRRAEPLDLSETIDYDGDGVPNDGDSSGSAFDAPCGRGGLTTDCDDNCPIVSNADQADDNADGVGNLCTVFDIFSGALRDSDGDGDRDTLDNCVWIYNPGQEDTSGLGADGIADGIGDACVEQVAQVFAPGGASFELRLGPTALLQLEGGTSFITIDFDNLVTLECDWEAGSCLLDTDKVEFCTHISGSSVLGGC